MMFLDGRDPDQGITIYFFKSICGGLHLLPYIPILFLKYGGGSVNISLIPNLPMASGTEKNPVAHYTIIAPQNSLCAENFSKAGK